MQLRVETIFNEGVAVLRLSGEVSLSTLPYLSDMLNKAIQEHPNAPFVVNVNDLPSLISFLRSVDSNAIRADTTTVFYTHKDDAPANNISSANVVCCLVPLSFFDSIRAKLQECVISVSLDPSKQKNAEAFRSLLSKLSCGRGLPLVQP